MSGISEDTYYDIIIQNVARLAEALGYEAISMLGGRQGVDVTVKGKRGRTVFVEVETGRYPKKVLERREKIADKCEGLILICPRIGIAKKHAREVKFPLNKLYVVLPTDYREVVPVLLLKLLDT